MARSLSLAAYRAYARRTQTKGEAYDLARPDGELLWFHAAEPSSYLAIEDLAKRLCAGRFGLSVVVTRPSEDMPKTGSWSDGNLSVVACPSEHPEAAQLFLDHWSPNIGLWVWGGLRPTLVAAALERGVSMALIDGDAAGFDGRRDRWLPDVNKQLLSRFSRVVLRSGAAQQKLEKLGLGPSNVEVSSPLQAGGQALPCQDTDLAEVSSALAGRPVWLAAGVQRDEIKTILAAHRHALRLSHRLLLIVHLADNTVASDSAEKAVDEGFKIKMWSSGDYPEDMTQVLIVEDEADLGLFYRLAPVTFFGGSLSPGRGGRNPFEAAALGSAVLYGPKVHQYLAFYSRLANAGAARIVNDAASLGTAITRLISPDQSATMALAGWDVISRGAEQSDLVVEYVQSALDAAEGAD